MLRSAIVRWAFGSTHAAVLPLSGGVELYGAEALARLTESRHPGWPLRKVVGMTTSSCAFNNN
ncbi:MAG TPA: hypothetical protein VL049_00350 [Candidatus Dormibacteraeota bacterium]|nr:hypothetical protein [Candidatus Dormibacteraeota bacterium]